MTINNIIKIPHIRITSFTLCEKHVKLYAVFRSKRHQCPKCGIYSTRVKGRYTRIISHLSIGVLSCNIELRVRKFRCSNDRCIQKVFSENIPYFPKYSRRSKIVDDIYNKISIELSGRKGVEISKLMGLNISKSTLIRLANNQSISQVPINLEVVGIDDFATKKGFKYGTVIIDHATSKPLDVLPSRTKKDVINWLRKVKPNNDIKRFTRDRDSSYSSAINNVFPEAMQVADRFHLHTNLSDALSKFYQGNEASFLAVAKSANSNKTTSIIETKNIKKEIKIKNKSIPKTRKELLFKEVKKLISKGHSIRKISKLLKCSRKTVTRYSYMDKLEPSKRSPIINMDTYRDFIIQKLKNKHTRKQVFTMIKDMGYEGSYAYMCSYVGKYIKTLSKRSMKKILTTEIKITAYKSISSRKFGKYIGAKISQIKDIRERNFMRYLIDNSDVVKLVRKLAITFKFIINNRHQGLDRWIKCVLKFKKEYNLIGLSSMTNGMIKDYDAVYNAINTKWSNGIVEGHVNRIKMIKREMYGRANFNLLRNKILLSS